MTSEFLALVFMVMSLVFYFAALHDVAMAMPRLNQARIKANDQQLHWMERRKWDHVHDTLVRTQRALLAIMAVHLINIGVCAYHLAR